MPKLKDLQISVRSESDHNLKHQATYPLMVTTDGLFKATIPDEIVQFVQECGNKRPAGERVKVVHEALRGGGSRHVATAKNVSWLGEVLREYGETLLKADVTTELRIFFEHNGTATFWVNPDGSIAPNGENENGEGKWYGRAMHSGFGRRIFEVGIGARILKVTKTTPPAGDPLFKYERVEPEDGLGEQGQLLDRFCNMPQPSAYGGEEVTDMKSVIYSEENAAFFVSMLNTMCQLTKRFDDFFGSKNIEALIASAGNPLLSGPE